MGNHHDHHHHSSDNIKVAFFLNFAFTILEIIGGLYVNSIAIISDAIHDLGAVSYTHLTLPTKA